MFKHLPLTRQNKSEDFIKEATIETLWVILKNILPDPYYGEVPIYCVIGALDECKDHDELLSRIQQILSVPTTSFNKPPKVKLLPID